MTTGIIANFVAKNRVSPDELPGLVATVHGALAGLTAEAADTDAEAPTPPSADQIRKFVRPVGITSLIDGPTFKSLRRHLAVHGHTPESYRAQFGLPADFPMVSPDYAAARSAMARAIGGLPKEDGGETGP